MKLFKSGGNETLKEKKLYYFYGPVYWITKTQGEFYHYISRDKKIFKWAFTKKQAKLLFKRELENILKEMPEPYRPLSWKHIFINEKNIFQEPIQLKLSFPFLKKILL